MGIALVFVVVVVVGIVTIVVVLLLFARRGVFRKNGEFSRRIYSI